MGIMGRNYGGYQDDDVVVEQAIMRELPRVLDDLVAGRHIDDALANAIEDRIDDWIDSAINILLSGSAGVSTVAIRRALPELLLTVAENLSNEGRRAAPIRRPGSAALRGRGGLRSGSSLQPEEDRPIASTTSRLRKKSTGRRRKSESTEEKTPPPKPTVPFEPPVELGEAVSAITAGTFDLNGGSRFKLQSNERLDVINLTTNKSFPTPGKLYEFVKEARANATAEAVQATVGYTELIPALAGVDVADMTSAMENVRNAISKFNNTNTAVDKLQMFIEAINGASMGAGKTILNLLVQDFNNYLAGSCFVHDEHIGMEIQIASSDNIGDFLTSRNKDLNFITSADGYFPKVYAAIEAIMRRIGGAQVVNGNEDPVHIINAIGLKPVEHAGVIETCTEHMLSEPLDDAMENIDKLYAVLKRSTVAIVTTLEPAVGFTTSRSVLGNGDDFSYMLNKEYIVPYPVRVISGTYAKPALLSRTLDGTAMFIL